MNKLPSRSMFVVHSRAILLTQFYADVHDAAREVAHTMSVAVGSKLGTIMQSFADISLNAAMVSRLLEELAKAGEAVSKIASELEEADNDNL